VLELAEELCVNAGYAAGFRGEVYGACPTPTKDATFYVRVASSGDAPIFRYAPYL